MSTDPEDKLRQAMEQRVSGQRRRGLVVEMRDEMICQAGRYELGVGFLAGLYLFGEEWEASIQTGDLCSGVGLFGIVDEVLGEPLADAEQSSDQPP